MSTKPKLVHFPCYRRSKVFNLFGKSTLAAADVISDLVVNDDYILTCGGDHKIKQWQSETFELLKTFSGKIPLLFSFRPF
jgi:hypothetical protein